MGGVFGVGSTELLIILLLAGIVLGPERLGKTARWLGRTVRDVRAYFSELSTGLSEELDILAELDEVKNDLKTDL